MRAVVQRVLNASVSIGGQMTASIEKGLMVLIGVEVGDTEKDARYIADKCVGLRIFDDEKGVPNLSVVDVGGSILAVSQFTLSGDARHGRRPSYIDAERPEKAKPLFETVKVYMREGGASVESGTFMADMQVSLVNDGPFTILLQSKKEF